MKNIAKELELTEFVSKKMVQDAVERNFEVIGEASAKVPEKIKEQYKDIPWNKMKAMRNFIIHQYDEVEEVAIWNTIQKDRPSLKVALLDLKVKEED